MWINLSLFILAFAVSLDGFGVGAMYGLRKIKIPLVSLIIIGLFSGVVILLAMQIGGFLTHYLQPSAARSIGAVILIGIGAWALVQVIRQNRKSAADQPLAEVEVNLTNQEIFHLELKKLGLVIQILRTPSLADQDASGVISSSEAVLLGLALSLDSFGAGIGAAFMGYPALGTALLIACSSGLFIYAGLHVGKWCAGVSWIQKLTYIPSMILIIMGISKLF